MNTVKDRLGTLLGKANRQPASHANGFNLESMNFKQSTKIELLLALVVFAYVLSVEAGEAVSDQIGTKT